LVDLPSYTADVTLHFTTGERYKVRKPNLSQDIDWLSDELLEKYVEVEDLDYFDAGEIQQIQSDLSNTSYYKNVEVRASVEDAVDKVIPVSVDLEHMNPKQYVYGVGYGTDTGARVQFGVTRRRVNKSGHHYRLQTRVSQIGYGLAATYQIPTGDPRTDSYGLSLNIEEEDSERKYRNVGIGGNYRFRDELWFKTYALNYQLEENNINDTVSTLLIPSAEWVRAMPFELEQRINVLRGNWLKLDLRGASDRVFSDTSFVQGKVSGKWIHSFQGGNRFIARGALGTTEVSDYEKLPLSLRFYTGGDRTVRGYEYETIAPLGTDSVVVGGKHLAEMSFEYEVPFRPAFSWAAFMDVGDAFDDKMVLRNSFGLGLRWRSPIGTIRVDAGRGLDSPGNGAWEFHLGIGPDF